MVVRKCLQALLFLALPSAAYSACPKLSAFYSAENTGWESRLTELEPLFELCLQSSQYFALLGAAQLNTGDVGQAIESLERALLLDADNGAALVDYSEALFVDGQLFSALEAGKLLTSRDDVPEELRRQILVRQQRWQKMTRQTSLQLSFNGGYDKNLNGAPGDSQIALTLSGEPILLSLSEEYRSVAGTFLSSGIALEHVRLAPDSQRSYLGQIRGRFSEDRPSDVIQTSFNYSALKVGQAVDRREGFGITHLNLRDRSLFSAANLSQRFEFSDAGSRCLRFINTEIQHQTWHVQRRLDGVEAEAGIGGLCSFPNLEGNSFGLELSVIKNFSTYDTRLGGDRLGWQLLGQWQKRVGKGLMTAQAEMASLQDSEGYSVLLDNNSRRSISRRSLLVQYRYPHSISGVPSELMLNFFHQDQRSNLDLFQITDTSLSVGVVLNF